LRADQIWPKLSFDLVNRWQRGFQRFRHLAEQLVFGDAHWLRDASQCVFGYQPVLFFAQEQADRGWSSAAFTCASIAERLKLS
jgi:hypothetical protein